MSSGLNLDLPSSPSENNLVQKISNYTKTAHKTLTDFTNEMSEILRQSIERIDNICLKVRGYDLEKNDSTKEEVCSVKSESQITQVEDEAEDPSFAMELLYVLRNERDLTKKRAVKKKANAKREPALITIKKLEKSLEKKLRQRHLETLEKSKIEKLAEEENGRGFDCVALTPIEATVAARRCNR